jgi:DNA-binding XRE family transcriptional regulator
MPRETGGFRIINPTYALELTREHYDSQAQLAEVTGVSRQFMTVLMRGDKTCRESVALSIARALDVDASLLFVDANGRPAVLPTQQPQKQTA